MQVSFSTSLSGIQAAIKRQDVTAHNVANVNTPGYEQIDVMQKEKAGGGVEISGLKRTPNPDKEHSNTDLAKEAVEQIQNKNSLKANVNAIKTQDKMLGALLDMKG